MNAPPPDNASVWSSHARQWHRVGPPLRPSEADAELMAKWAASANPAGACLVLGVTPEIFAQAWLADRQLWAVDHSESMARALWRKDRPAVTARRHVCVVARWQQSPLTDGGTTLAIGDGSLNALPSLQELQHVLAELHRVLAPSGWLVIRAFVRPSEAESLKQVVQHARQGRIGSFDAFKWRLAMSLVEGDDASVAVAQVARCFDQLFPDRAALAAATGWPIASIHSIDAYQGSATRYVFPTRGQFERALDPHFRLMAIECPSYELGERCPTIAAQRLNASC